VSAPGSDDEQHVSGGLPASLQALQAGPAGLAVAELEAAEAAGRVEAVHDHVVIDVPAGTRRVEQSQHEDGRPSLGQLAAHGFGRAGDEGRIEAALPGGDQHVHRQHTPARHFGQHGFEVPRGGGVSMGTQDHRQAARPAAVLLEDRQGNAGDHARFRAGCPGAWGERHAAGEHGEGQRCQPCRTASAHAAETVRRRRRRW